MDKDSSCTGIIFKINNSKYADKLISVIDSEGKKVVLLAKGVRQHASKRAQYLEIGNLIKTKYVKGYGVGILTDIKIIEEYRNWKIEMENILYLQMICEIISYFIYEENLEVELYTILKDTLSIKTERIDYIVAIFCLKLLNCTGHLPELDKDVRTSEELISKDACPIVGGIGYTKYIDSEPTDSIQRIYKSQRFALINEPHECLRIKLPKSEDSQMLQLSLNWVESVIEKKIKSREILEGMNM